MLVEHILYVSAVIYRGGVQPTPYLSLGYKTLIGQEWQLQKPHGLLYPILIFAVSHLINATVDQQNGYRFFIYIAT